MADITETNVATTEQQETETLEKTFSQEDVNGIAAKEAKKAQEKILRELGIGDDVKSVKQGLAQFKEWQETQKSESEKKDEAITALTGEKDILTQQLTAQNQRIIALEKGIPAEKVAAYAKLAESYVSEDTDLSAAFDKALADFPLPDTKQQVPGAGSNPPSVPPPKSEPKTARDRIAQKNDMFFK